ncbi:MAG: class I SAM-dependent methyltransferase [Deltaproteobacteria bacterium]|nr:class I SAM-dependent methyltransferase [Deltaproteobacteria bacterium]
MAASSSSNKSKQVLPETRPITLREGVIRRTDRHINANGRISFKCIPSLVDHYVSVLETQFKILGRPYAPTEVAQLRANVLLKLEEGWKASPYSRVVVEYKTDPPPNDGLSYVVTARIYTLPELYKEWVDTRTPPLFGAHPDCKVMHTAASLGAPQDVPILDIGAGTGRNTIPLARAGHPASAVELSPALVQILKKTAEDEKLEVKVIEGDILDDNLAIPENAYKLVILCEVVSHFREVSEIRCLLRRLAPAIQPGGILLFSCFFSHDSYTPDKLSREASRAFWASLFTRKELAEAIEGFPFERIGDESVHDYEKEHLPASAWPPTGWFAGWASGYDVYKLTSGRTPIELRWVTLRRV